MDYGVLLSAFDRAAGPDTAVRMPQQQRLYGCLREAILSGRIEEGARLPSSRALADELTMARNSVLYAYERLVAEGFVRGSRQGTRVARVGLNEAPARATGALPPLSRRVTGIAASTAEDLTDPLPFLPGTPALDEFPLATWRRCVERAWRRARPAQLGYMPPEGNAALRQAIAEYLRVARGARCEARQVFITDGTQNCLHLCALMLADAGELAWIENPGYHGAHRALQAADLRLVPIAVDAEGLYPRPRDWLDTPPRLIYITPSHQYPLGAVMSLERRLALLAQAHASGAWIIEDDYDSEFRHPGSPLSALQGLVDQAPVVYLGTFSKVMFPGLRIGFMVVPQALVPVVRHGVGALSLRGRVAEQLALADFIESGHFTRHLRRMRRLYAERRATLEGALARHLAGLVTISGGGGGMHLSVRLEAPVSDVAVSRVARGRGLVLRPLSRHCLPGTERYNGFMLGYGGVPAARMDALVRGIGEAIALTGH